jgi:hypothetical protein
MQLIFDKQYSSSVPRGVAVGVGKEEGMFTCTAKQLVTLVHRVRTRNAVDLI